MKKKKRKSSLRRDDRNQSRKHIHLLSNKLLAPFLTREQKLRLLAACLATYGESERTLKLQELYASEDIRGALGLIANSIGEMSSLPYFGAAPNAILDLMRITFEYHESLLIDFEAHRMAFENFVLLGDLQRANDELDAVQKLCGESLWLIRGRLLLLSLHGDTAGLSTYTETCKSETTDAFLSTLFTWCLLLTTDPPQHIKIIFSNAKELAKAGLPEVADLLTLLFIPQPLLERWRPLNCLGRIQYFPLVDRYVLVEKLFRHNGLGHTAGDHETQKYFHQYRECAQKKRGIQPDEDHVAQAVRLYETERYEDAIAYIFANTRYIRTPLALVNLVSKSRALAQIPVGKGHSVMDDIDQSLAHIYSLDKSAKQSEDELKSKAILLNHFRLSDHIQNACSISSPHAFSLTDRVAAARKCTSIGDTISPWSSMIATGADPIIFYSYLSQIPQVPSHRQTKNRIRELCRNPSPINTEELERLLDHHQRQSPLLRDHLELAASALLAHGKDETLLATCANALARNASAFTSLPVRHIAGFIERTRNCSLDAVIVCYFYAKYIDPERTYLLNETYEEYLLVNDARKPSDLHFETSDPKFILLLRDISTIPTMDFLGTFESSNELRAERIRLLDLLRDTQAITPEQHRAEADEILSQVIVDSEATQFNVSKINVDALAIRTKISDEVSALFELYKSVKDDPGDAFIKYAGDPQREASMSVVAGDKNTTLLRIVNLVRDIFLYDDRLGLDRNLSAEIRHGFFSNLMRSRPEASHLLTEVDEDGVYQENVYWLERNQLVYRERLEQISEHLRWFSSEFNQLLSRAEEWMKVTEKVDSGERIFAFPVYKKTFENIRDIADQLDTGDELVEVLVYHFIERLDLALARMREKINVDLKVSIDSLFDELLHRLNEARGGVALVELIEAVIQAKNDIREDITTASGWFERTVAQNHTERTLPHLVDIASECYGRVRSTPLVLVKSVDEGLNVKLSGSQVKAFLLALINLFENCVRHSGFGPNTPVNVSVSSTDHGWTVRVSNPITKEAYQHLQAGRFAEAQRRVNAEGTADTIRVEGGSGLGKVVNQLQSISNCFQVSIFIQDSTFLAEIKHETAADS